MDQIVSFFSLNNTNLPCKTTKSQKNQVLQINIANSIGLQEPAVIGKTQCRGIAAWCFGTLA